MRTSNGTRPQLDRVPQLSVTNRVREELQAALGVGQRLPTEQGEPRALEGLRGHDEPRAHLVQVRDLGFGI